MNKPKKKKKKKKKRKKLIHDKNAQIMPSFRIKMTKRTFLKTPKVNDFSD